MPAAHAAESSNPEDDDNTDTGFAQLTKAIEESTKKPGEGTIEELTLLKELSTVTTKLVLAAFLGGYLGFIYPGPNTARRSKRFSSMIETQVMLCVGGALIWIVVANNIVRAFGLAGALALIRYRTVMKNPKDTTIVLLSMVIGMACGLGQYAVALSSSFVVSIVLATIWLVGKHISVPSERPELKGPEEEEESMFDEDSENGNEGNEDDNDNEP